MSVYKLSKEEIRGCIEAEITAEEYTLHRIIPTGHSEYLRFYLVLWTEPHPDVEDATLRKLRYFQIPRQPEETPDLEPTFKTNGIAIRDEEGARSGVVKDLIAGWLDVHHDTKTGIFPASDPEEFE